MSALKKGSKIQWRKADKLIRLDKNTNTHDVLYLGWKSQTFLPPGWRSSSRPITRHPGKEKSGPEKTRALGRDFKGHVCFDAGQGKGVTVRRRVDGSVSLMRQNLT